MVFFWHETGNLPYLFVNIEAIMLPRATIMKYAV